MRSSGPQPGLPPRPRRRFQYGLRTLLAATALVAVLLSLFCFDEAAREIMR